MFLGVCYNRFIRTQYAALSDDTANSKQQWCQCQEYPKALEQSYLLSSCLAGSLSHHLPAQCRCKGAAVLSLLTQCQSRLQTTGCTLSRANLCLAYTRWDWRDSFSHSFIHSFTHSFLDSLHTLAPPRVIYVQSQVRLLAAGIPTCLAECHQQSGVCM